MLPLALAKSYLIYNVVVGAVGLAVFIVGFLVLRRLLRWLDHKD